jgi:hypothetical protein
VPELERAKLAHVPNLAGLNRRDLPSDNNLGFARVFGSNSVCALYLRVPLRCCLEGLGYPIGLLLGVQGSGLV